MLSVIRKSCVLAVMAAGLSATAMSDVSEARGGRGFGGGHRGGGFRHAGGFRSHSPRHIGHRPVRRMQSSQSPAQGFRRGIAPRKHVVGSSAHRGVGRSRMTGGRKIAGRRHVVRRWRHAFRRHHRWGIGRRHWRGRYFGFLFAMAANDYTNPYCDAGDGGGAGEEGGCYDYNQPVTGDSEPTEEGQNLISQADEAFQKGDYESALNLSEKAVKQMPKNADLHQFRSLCLFALKRYRESGMAAHAALVGGKGWNWDTLRGFYPEKDVYTGQLRNLEQSVKDKPTDAAGQFLLGYHYMMLGHSDAAGSQMATVVKLEPRDKLAAKMLVVISQKTGKQYGGQPVDDAKKPMQPAPASSDPSALPMDEEPLQPGNVTPTEQPAAKTAAFSIVGNWKASADGSVITLSFTKDGKFRWSAKDGGQSFTIDGTYTLTNNLLKMTSPKEKQPLEGTLTAKGGNEFELKLKDAEADEPALTFKRQ
jgi:uncharacterized protein (TIGR03066 family)